MKKSILMLLLFVILAVAGYYFYQEKYAQEEIVSMENSLEAICDSTEDDCSEAEEGFEV